MTLQTQKYMHNDIELDEGRAWTCDKGNEYPANWWKTLTPSVLDESGIVSVDRTDEELVYINGIHPDTIHLFDPFIQNEMQSQADTLGIPLDEHLMNVYVLGSDYYM